VWLYMKILKVNRHQPIEHIFVKEFSNTRLQFATLKIQSDKRQKY
jgi:hypothetical protein